VTGPTIPLDQLKLKTLARIAAIDWDVLEEGEARRLRQFGFDEGVMVEHFTSARSVATRWQFASAG